MVLRPGSSSHEKILLYGPEGAGKTRSVFSIAKHLVQTSSPGMVYLADEEHRADRFKATFPLWSANMVIEPVEDHGSLVQVVDKWYAGATPEDWLCLDNLGMAWNEAKDWVLNRVYGQEISDWLVEDLEGKHRKDYGRTQDAQNKAWMDLGHVMLRWPGHVLACTPAKPVFEDRDKPNPAMAKYRKVGYQPEGQRYIGHLFHTIMYICDLGEGVYTMTTIKDVERAKVVNRQWGDFCTDYLVGIARWVED